MTTGPEDRSAEFQDLVLDAEDDEDPDRFRTPLPAGQGRAVDHPIKDSISVLGLDWNADPFEDMAWMRKNAPVYWDDPTGIWAVAGHAEILKVEANWETFNSGNGSRPQSSVPSMIDSDPPEHTRRRRIVSSGFTPRRVEAHETFLRATVTELIDAVYDQGSCEFVGDIAASVPLRMIATLMGLPTEDEEKLIHWSDLFATGGEEVSEQVVEAVIDYANYIVAEMAKRDDPEAEDLISLLMYNEGETLTPEDLIYETMLILVGGDETTRHVMSRGLEQLLRNPDQLEMLRNDRSLLDSAIEEMLRWATPVRNMARTASADTELGGQTIKAGEKLLLLYLSANRDEAVFENPDQFDITREKNRHVAFGGNGRHFCLGAQLARLELRVLFTELLDRFTDLRLAHPDAPGHERRGNFVLGLETLPVTWTVSS